MGLWDKIKGEFIDIIEFVDDTQNTISYRFERYNKEIKQGAKLTVREGQRALFVNEGKLADIFEPGLHTLETKNLPILSTLQGWKYGFSSPFKAEIYFINTTRFTDQKWGTKSAVILNDDRFGMLEIRAFGSYEFSVGDPEIFLKTLVGTDGNFTNDEINGQLRNIIVTRFTDAVGEAQIPVELFAAQLNELSALLEKIMVTEFADYGLTISKLLVESVTMPEDVKKDIFSYSRLNKIDLNKLAQLKAAEAMEAAANNEGGAAGAGMGMGMGFAMANQMGNATQPAAAPTPPATPPPLPTAAQVFIAENGQQAGPFDVNTLKSFVASGRLLPDTLVWKEGMSAWTAAKDTPDTQSLFGAVPPPIPGA